jgi:nucleoside-diphosphate-sugar epimerase
MVFVTGGTGFLGSHLIHSLLLKGKTIRALKRKNSNFELFERVFSFYNDIPAATKTRIEWVDGDLSDIILLDRFLQNVTEVYHAAGIVSFQPGDRKRLMHTNVEGTANLVNTALEHDIRKFCYVSSIAAIGRADNNTIIDENTVWKASKRNSNYAVSKYGGEREVWRGIEEGLKAVIVNPAVILGPGELDSGFGKMITVVLKGLKFYSKGTNGFVDVRDVARAMTELTGSNITGERFIVSSGNHTYKEIFEMIAEETGKPAPKIEANSLMANIAWMLSFFQGKFLNRKPLITKETAITASETYRYSNTKIKEALYYNFIPIRDTIKDACSFYTK